MTTATMHRHEFIRRTGALGLGLAFALDIRPAAVAAKAPPRRFAPNAWVRIAPDESVTVVLSKSEMGQGVSTGLPIILGEELDANPATLRFEFAPAMSEYADPALGAGKIMVTGGSTSVKDLWMPLRTAGATARAMLIAAAAAQWAVPAAACRTAKGTVFHDASGRRATYGSLVAAASALPVPKDVPLKPQSSFTLIGSNHPRLDVPSKVNGVARYGIDVRVPGMHYAAIARAPVFGGRVRSFNATRARRVKGVTHVVQISNGVAVVARNTWAAFQGQAALDIVWDNGPQAHVDTQALRERAAHLAASSENEHVAVTRGSLDHLDGEVINAVYEGPLLAHATMEPMNATAHVRDDACDVWAPNQVQTFCQSVAASITGLAPEKCAIHTTFLGGGFGRRLETDYVREAVEVSKAVKLPVKVQWTREDDMQHDFYRPMSRNTVQGVIASGKLVGLSHQVVQASWFRHWLPQGMASGIDPTALTDIADTPYLIPNMRVSYIEDNNGIPTGSWRAPNANWNDFVTESFVDELAHAAGKDPLEFRLALLHPKSRPARVLQMVADKAGWGRSQPAGVAQGLAHVNWEGSFGAMIAFVSMIGKTPKVHRVVVAVDCGTVVNPDIVRQQCESATIFGLSAALTGKITIKGGRVEQNNFYDYTVLRMADAPKVEVHIVPSTEAPTGIGELCTPPIAPAVGNAVFRLTRKRARSLPFSDSLA
jgi:CO/xanthine dehydrogenase Mo-binding subunit